MDIISTSREMKQKVVIIGHGYLSRLALIRSLGQAGYDVTVIVTMYGDVNTTRPLDCYSKYVSEVYYCNAKDNDGLIKLLAKHCVCNEQKVIIVPDSDWAASIIDSNRDLLSEHFLFPRINDESVHIADWMDKERQKKLARDLELSVPGTTTLHIHAGIIPDLSNIHYPCFTKALTTMVGGKQCFRRCGNENELRNALIAFTKIGFVDILVEDFIDIEREYAVVGLTDGKNVFIPGVIQFLENCQCHFGIARKGRILPIKGYEKLIEHFKQYVKATNFVGLFDIDFLYSKGFFYFCEMNFRYGGSGYAYTMSGINLPALYVSFLTGMIDLDDLNDSVVKEQTYVNERMLLDDFIAMNISISDFNRALNTANIRFIHDVNDPIPEQLFKKMVCKAKIKYILKKLLRNHK